MSLARWVGILGALSLATGAAVSGPAGFPAPEEPMKAAENRSGSFTFAVPGSWTIEYQESEIRARPKEEPELLIVRYEPRRAQSLAELAEKVAARGKKDAETSTRLVGQTTWREASRAALRIAGVEGLLLQATKEDFNGKHLEEHGLILTPRHEVDIEFSCSGKDSARMEKVFQIILGTVRLADAAPPATEAVRPGMQLLKDRNGAFTLQIPANWKVLEEQMGWNGAARPEGDLAILAASWGFLRSCGDLQELAQKVSESEEALYANLKAPRREVSRSAAKVGGADAVRIRSVTKERGVEVTWDHYAVLTPQESVDIKFASPQIDAVQNVIQEILSTVRFTGGTPRSFAAQPTPPQPIPPQPTPPGPLPAPAPAQDGIVGSWLLRTEQAEVRAEFRADGRYSRSVRTAQLAQAETGTYRAAQGTIELHPDAGGQVVQLRYQMPDANRLIATDAQGIGTELVRQVDAPQPGPSPVPTPVPPNPMPGPMPGAMKQVQDQNGAFALSLPGDWRVQQQPGAMTACDATGQAFVQVISAPKQAQSMDQFAQAAVANWRQSVPQWQAVGQQAVQVAGRQALQIRATGSPNNAAMMADYFLVLGDQCQVIVTVFCPQAAFPQRMATFQQIVQTLQVR